VAYSVGRLLFFMVREDENFKSKRSYTTAYMALGTLAGAACAASFSIYQAAPSPISQFAASPSAIAAAAGTTSLPLLTISQFILLAGVLAGINFVVQALHHHEKVGQFPDFTALAGFRAQSSGMGSATAAILGSGMWTEEDPASGQVPLVPEKSDNVQCRDTTKTAKGGQGFTPSSTFHDHNDQSVKLKPQQVWSN